MGKTLIGGYLGIDTPAAVEAFYPVTGGVQAGFHTTREQTYTCPVGNFTEGTDFRLERVAVLIEENALATDATLHLRMDGSDTPAAVTIPAGETGWFFSDALNAQSWPVAETHDVVYRLERPAVGALRVGSVFVIAEITDSTHGAIILAGFPYSGYGLHSTDPYEVRGVGYYEDQPNDGISDFRKRHKFRHGGSVRALRVTSGGGSTKDADHKVLVMLNGSATSMEITVPASSAGPADFEDTTNVQAFALGDELAIGHDDGAASSGSASVDQWFVVVETDGPTFDLPFGANTGSGFFHLYPGADERATATDSRTIGLGPLTFSLAEGARAYAVGDRIRISDAADKTNFIEGAVTDYTDPSLTIDVDRIGGSGTFASWNVNKCVATRMTAGQDGAVLYAPFAADAGGVPVLFDTSLEAIRVSYIFYGYSPGENDLPFHLRAFVNGTPAGLAALVPTPASLGDWDGEGEVVAVSPPLALTAGDVVTIELGLQFPEDADDALPIGAEGYPVMMALTFGAASGGPDTTRRHVIACVN